MGEEVYCYYSLYVALCSRVSSVHSNWIYISQYLQYDSPFFNAFSIFAIVVFDILKSLLIYCDQRENDIVIYAILCKLLQILFTWLDARKILRE